MPLISSSLPNLANGVSQQPNVMRLSSQGEAQINGYSSVVEGVGKRPSFYYLGKLSGVTGSAYIHTINRDITERYSVAVDNGSLRVFDMNGVEKTVNAPNGFSYLNSSTPRDDFRCITVADFTFILNTSKKVVKGSSTTPTRVPEALIWVRSGSYGGTYKVFLDNNTVAAYTVPDGSTASHTAYVKTSYIAEQLVAQIISNTGGAYTVSRYGSSIHLYRNNSADFLIKTEGPLGDNSVECVKSRVQSFANLPSRAVSGFRVEITGDSSSTFDNYYVEFDTEGTSQVEGVWKEVAKGGELDSLDASSMPHALIREADGTFTFDKITWLPRLVGDTDSAPYPSFVGRTINDVFFHRNRLGFVADENLVMSKAGDFFNFFRGTAASVLDDDPIDVGVSHVKVSLLRHAVPFNETLLLFSDQTQFQLGSSTLLTPETVSINNTTEYECSLKAKPLGIGKFVYFAVSRGTFSGVREYFVDSNTESLEATEVTAHVPKYLKGSIVKMAASSNEDALALITDGVRNKIYVYKFYFSGEEKLQASWSEWELGEEDKVMNIDFIESKLFVVVERADGVHLEVMNLEPAAKETGWDLHVHLDSKVTEAAVSPLLRTDLPKINGHFPTQLTLPYKASGSDNIQIVCAPNGPLAEGTLLSKFTIDNSGATTVIIVNEDLLSQPLYIGKQYTFRYRFSSFLIKQNTSTGGQSSVNQGRLQLRNASVLYADTGYFRVEVTPKFRATNKYIYNGGKLGSASFVLGKPVIDEGSFRFPILSKNDQVEIDLINDSFLPSHFLSADWEGFYHTRSRRV